MIKRYNVGYLGLEEHPKGRYVAHGDHVEIVQKLEGRVRGLEQSLESADREASDLIQQLSEVQRAVDYYEAQHYNDQMGDYD